MIYDHPQIWSTHTAVHRTLKLLKFWALKVHDFEHLKVIPIFTSVFITIVIGGISFLEL